METSALPAQAWGEVFLFEHNQNIGLDDPDLFGTPKDFAQGPSEN
jgi:hypothetical protein